MVQHGRFGCHHRLEIVEGTLEVRDQYFNLAFGHPLANSCDGVGEHARTTVGKVITVDRRQHGMTQPHLLDGSCSTIRLSEVHGTRLAGIHIAESARPCACLSKEHQGRGPGLPALEDVRATGFFADCVEFHPPHQLLQIPETVGGEIRPDPHPLGLAGLTGEQPAHGDRHLFTTVRREDTGRNHGVNVVRARSVTIREYTELHLGSSSKHFGRSRDQRFDD